MFFLPFWSDESFPLHKTINPAWSFCLFSLSTSPTQIFSRIPRSVIPRNFTSPSLLRRRKTHASFWMNMPSLLCCRLNKMMSVILLVLKLRHSVVKVLWIYERRNHYNYGYYLFFLTHQSKNSQDPPKGDNLKRSEQSWKTESAECSFQFSCKLLYNVSFCKQLFEGQLKWNFREWRGKGHMICFCSSLLQLQ